MSLDNFKVGRNRRVAQLAASLDTIKPTHGLNGALFMLGFVSTVIAMLLWNWAVVAYATVKVVTVSLVRVIFLIPASAAYIAFDLLIVAYWLISSAYGKVTGRK